MDPGFKRIALTTLAKRPVLNEVKLDEILGNNIVIAAGMVIKQDPAPGTPIQRGGGVTLTIARTRDFPVGIIEGAHIAFEDRLIGEVYDEMVKINPQPVLDIFDEVEDYADLTESQRHEVDLALEKLGVGGGGPAAYKGAQGVLTLGVKG